MGEGRPAVLNGVGEAEPRRAGTARRASVDGMDRIAAALAPLEVAGPTLARRLVNLAVTLRWVTVVAGVVVGSRRPIDRTFVVAAIALGIAALLLSTPRARGPHRGPAAAGIVGAELVVAVGATAATGGLDSPLILTPLTGLLLAGYALGARATVGTAIAGAIAALATISLQVAAPGDERAASQVVIVYLLCGALGALARNLVIEIEAQRAAAIDHAAEMATANDLLVALHGLLQTLPASFDLGDALDSVRARLRTFVDWHVLVLLVRDDATRAWNVALAEGVKVPARLADGELPAPLRRSIAARRPVVIEDRLVRPDDDGFAALARSGLYSPLCARGEVVALLAVEEVAARAYGPHDAEVLRNLAGALALPVDNARWFRRIRTIGAEAERARIARELHDRIAQSLAYVTFELERMQAQPEAAAAELRALQGVVREIVGDLRATIYQLRAGVTEHTDLAAIAAEYLPRWEARSGVPVTWSGTTGVRLPPPVEQELWRILQEALANVERHARARRVDVAWHVGRSRSRLTVTDDGCGFEPEAVGDDHFGILGMRERADALGARLAVESERGHGTRVAVDVEMGTADATTDRRRRERRSA